MPAAEYAAKVAAFYPRIAALSPAAKEALFQNAVAVREQPGMLLMDLGKPCPGLFFTLSGEKRVFSIDESGKEVTLYPVGPGDYCSLNVIAVLAAQPFPAHVEILTEANFIYTPAADLRRCMQDLPEISAVIYDVLYHDTHSLLSLLAEIAFRRVNERLKDYLLQRAEDGVVKATHQRIANELGTSREVITRLLKDFSQQGRIETSRGEIQLLPGALDE